MQELHKQELRAKLAFEDSDREKVHGLSFHQEFLQSEINDEDFIQRNHHNEQFSFLENDGADLQPGSRFPDCEIDDLQSTTGFLKHNLQEMTGDDIQIDIDTEQILLEAPEFSPPAMPMP